MTNEACATFCTGYKFFATEYSRECYCGNTLNPASGAAPLAECSMTCAGNPLQYCGGPSRLELYNNTAAAGGSGGPTRPATVAGGWALYGCQTEGSGGRALASKSYAADGMTLESCTAFCAGYQYAGVEYARECYCGNSFAAGSVAAPAGECDMTCAGNPSNFCGGPSRLSVYKSS
jgi:hypothetical protein